MITGMDHTVLKTGPVYVFTTFTEAACRRRVKVRSQDIVSQSGSLVWILTLLVDFKCFLSWATFLLSLTHMMEREDWFLKIFLTSLCIL